MPQVVLSDAVARDFNIDKNAKCQCGRDNAYIHCSHCGSTAFYALKARSSQARAVTPQGNITSVRVFSCRSCLEVFPEDASGRNCKARPTAAMLREDKVVHKLTGGKHTEAFESGLLAEYFKLHPERRPAQHAPEVNKATGDVGLLERVASERVEEKDNAHNAIDPDRERAKLFEEPKLDNGEETSS